MHNSAPERRYRGDPVAPSRPDAQARASLAADDEVSSSRKRKVALAAIVLAVGVGLTVRAMLPASDVKPMPPIFDVVSTGNAAAVRSAVTSNSVLSAKDPDGNTPLHKAVLGNWPEVVKVLLESGAPTEEVNHEGYTPLGYAVLIREWDPSQAVAALVAAGADVTVKFPSGEPLIHEVVRARKGNDPVLKALLTTAPDTSLSARNKAGQTPADVARSTGNTTALELIARSPGSKK